MVWNRCSVFVLRIALWCISHFAVHTARDWNQCRERYSWSLSLSWTSVDIFTEYIRTHWSWSHFQSHSWSRFRAVWIYHGIGLKLEKVSVLSYRIWFLMWKTLWKLPKRRNLSIWQLTPQPCQCWKSKTVRDELHVTVTNQYGISYM